MQISQFNQKNSAFLTNAVDYMQSKHLLPLWKIAISHSTAKRTDKDLHKIQSEKKKIEMTCMSIKIKYNLTVKGVSDQPLNIIDERFSPLFRLSCRLDILNDIPGQILSPGPAF